MNGERDIDFLENLAKQWDRGKINLFGVLHTATPGESDKVTRFGAQRKLVRVFGKNTTREAIGIWERAKDESGQ
jgi:hypothetical protein